MWVRGLARPKHQAGVLPKWWDVAGAPGSLISPGACYVTPSSLAESAPFHRRKDMPTIDLPADLQARVEAFRPVVNEVLEADVSFEDCLKIVIERGLDTVLADLLGAADAAVLLASFQRLSEHDPKAVYSFVAQMLRDGGELNREQARQRIGFGPPEE